jgi:hypothetical protein
MVKILREYSEELKTEELPVGELTMKKVSIRVLKYATSFP